jgi:hypothetical protein
LPHHPSLATVPQPQPQAAAAARSDYGFGFGASRDDGAAAASGGAPPHPSQLVVCVMRTLVEARRSNAAHRVGSDQRSVRRSELRNRSHRFAIRRSRPSRSAR